MLHGGWDLACPTGTPVAAAAEGVVLFVTSPKEDRVYGNLVVLGHANSIQTAYAHNSAVLVEIGDARARGRRGDPRRLLVRQAGANLEPTGLEPQPHLAVRACVRAGGAIPDPLDRET